MYKTSVFSAKFRMKLNHGVLAVGSSRQDLDLTCAPGGVLTYDTQTGTSDNSQHFLVSFQAHSGDPTFQLLSMTCD